MSYWVVILRTPPYWSVRVASCNFKLGGWFISLPITHCKRYDVQTCYYFRRRVKRFIVEKSGQSSWRRAKQSWLVGVRWRKRFRLGENCLLRSSLHQYINNQHPIAKNDNCLVRRHPRTPASCDTVVWIQPWTRNEKIGSKWVQTWMFGRQTFEFWEGARQMWAHRSL